MPDNPAPEPKKQPGRISRLIDRTVTRSKSIIDYAVTGVWSDTRTTPKVSLVKILNLTVRSVINPNFQNLAAAMTYRTVLAIVPVLALLFAVCRGFGFQNMLTSQLYSFFPSQHKLLETAMKFVDSYLAQASEGLFVGVGIVFLLWTVISLMSSLEDSFNSIWDAKEGRTLWRKATDYLGIFIILPILIICSQGITIVFDTTLKKFLPEELLTPTLSVIFTGISFILTCLFFTCAYLLIPNAKVKFLNALAAGTLAGLAYTVLQWLFVSGQMYVSKYNAIYGSFSFLPLFLIWLQLVWLFTFVGAEICYASQNFRMFNFQSHIQSISLGYRLRVDVAIVLVIARRFIAGEEALNAEQISEKYNIPLMLVELTLSKLLKAGVITYISTPEGEATGQVVPAREVATMSLGNILTALYNRGDCNFIPGFRQNFSGVETIMAKITNAMIDAADSTPLTSIEIHMPTQNNGENGASGERPSD